MVRSTISAFWDRENNNNINSNFVELYEGQSHVGKQVDDLKSLLVQNSLSDEKIAKLITATPKGVYPTVESLRTTYPRGSSGIYIISNDGNWYYWNNVDWVSGGKYQATGVPTELTFSAVNIIKNGNFINDKNGFSFYGDDANYIINQGTISITGKGAYSNTGLRTIDSNNFVGAKGHKIYVKSRMRVTNDKCLNLKMYISGGNTTQAIEGGNVVNPLLNTWYEKSGIVTVPETMDNKPVSIFFVAEYSSSTESNGKTLEVYRPMAIDLTATFGEGLEWNNTDFTNYLSAYSSNAWFEGSLQISTVKDYIVSLKKELETLKQNKNADYELLEDFTTGWTMPESTSALKIIDDKRINLTNTSSKRMEIINSQGVPRYIDKVINKSFGSENKSMMLKLWIEDTKAVEYISVYFGNIETSWATNGRFAFKGDGGGDFAESGGILRKGWNYLSLNSKELIKTSGFSFDNPIKKIRVSVTPKTNEKTTVVFDSIWINGKGNPKFVFTFDDAWRTVYENAYPKMKQAGIVGTNYVIGEYIANQREFSNWFQTVDMLKDLEKNGWCNGNHTWLHNYYFEGEHTPESYVQLLDQNRNWMLNNGVGASGSLHVCYPKGEYDQNVITLMEARGYKSARAAGSRGTHPIEIDKKFEILSRSFHKDVTLQQAKDWVDMGVDSGGTTFFQFHQIPLDDTTTNGQENPYISWSKDKFEALIDYMVSKGLVDNCLTHAEWFDYMSRNNLVGD